MLKPPANPAPFHQATLKGGARSGWSLKPPGLDAAQQGVPGFRVPVMAGDCATTDASDATDVVEQWVLGSTKTWLKWKNVEF
jgi:hypothetical protein